MSKRNNIVFVLWGQNFDEVAAAIFITEFRKVGLRVKVVALTPRRLGGAHGLSLGTDMTLEQALKAATKALCVVLPGSTSKLAQLTNDPRLSEFISLARNNQARFITAATNSSNMSDLLGGNAEIITYPSPDALLEFAEDIAGEWGG